MLRFLIGLCLLPCSFLGAASFEDNMGKGSSSWQYLRTPEDRQKLRFFQTLYDKSGEVTTLDEAVIPKVFHFIWLGPDPFPSRSISLLTKWKAFHPDWIFYFWTDIPRDVPLKGMVKREVSEFAFQKLGKCFDQAENFKEKAFLLSLEILFSEGGIYLDHDVEPKKNLSPSASFFAGLAPLQPSIFSSSVMIVPYCFGASKGHPFLGEAMEHLAQYWNRYSSFFPGSEPQEKIYRTEMRLYEAFEIGAEKGLGLSGNRDRALPADEMASLVTHHRQGKWKKLETIEETKLRKKLDRLSKQVDRTVLFICLLGGGVLLTSGFCFWPRRKK